MQRVRVGLLVALSAVALSSTAVASTPLTSMTASDHQNVRSDSTQAENDVRIVWDDALSGIRIMSARTDGSDRTVLYERRSQEAYNLAVSPNERLVAFSPFGRSGPRVRLVVASTASQRARNILPRNSGATGIGPIGWSRDGRRLVFMSFVDEPDRPDVHARLFSISRTGKSLRRGRPVNASAIGVAIGDLVVIPQGIVHKDGNTIRLFPTLDSRTRGRVVARHAYGMRASGNGRWLFYQRSTPRGRQSLQRVRSTGGRSTTVVSYRDDGLDKPYAYASDTSGARLVISGQAEDNSPRASILNTQTLKATDLTFARGKISIAW